MRRKPNRVSVPDESLNAKRQSTKHMRLTQKGTLYRNAVDLSVLTPLPKFVSVRLPSYMLENRLLKSASSSLALKHMRNIQIKMGQIRYTPISTKLRKSCVS